MGCRSPSCMPCVPAVLADMGSCSCMVVAYNLHIRLSTPATLALPGRRGVAVVGPPEQGSLPKAGFPACGIQYTGLCTLDVLDVISRDGDG